MIGKCHSLGKCHMSKKIFVENIIWILVFFCNRSKPEGLIDVHVKVWRNEEML
jgi:hypothetical protein